VQQRLPLPRPTRKIPSRAIILKLRDVPFESQPAPNLPLIIYAP
jgi:hypothetical protein